MGAASKSMRPSEGVQFEIIDEQDYYTRGEPIIGRVVVDFKRSQTMLTSLLVSLSYTAGPWTLRHRPQPVYAYCESVQLAGESVVLGAGRHAFPVTLRTPDDPANYPPSIARCYALRRHGYTIAWSVTVQLNARIVGQFRSLNLTSSRPVTVFPAPRGPQRAITEKLRLREADFWSMFISLTCPNEIPQAPKFCAIQLNLDVKTIEFEISVDVYVKQTTVRWSNRHARVRTRRLPIGYAVIDRYVHGKVELDGEALGWGLKSMQPDSFMFASFCMSYDLYVDVFTPRVGRMVTQPLEVRIAPPEPLGGTEDTHDLPAYYEKNNIVHDDNS